MRKTRFILKKILELMLQHANKILYLERGQIRSFGDIDTVRNDLDVFDALMKKIKN